MWYFRTMEESLKSVLHCDDKEKLKERLAILQREYNRTVQRLKRAERSEAVRNHVRSRLAEQNLRQEGPEPCGLPDPSEAKVGRQCSVNQSVPEDKSQSPSVRFRLPHDVIRPTAGSSESSLLSDASQACSPGQQVESRQRSVHRLRSRRSRLRWERRERTDSDAENTENSEDGRDPAGDRKQGGTSSAQIHSGAATGPSAVGEASTERAQDQGRGTLSVTTHRAESGRGRGACDALVSDVRMAAVLEPPESSVMADTPSPSLSDAAGAPSGAVSEASTQEPEAPAQGSPQPSVSRPGPAPESPGAGCLDSCTLIEGLLFPVEYYVRTTRRMSAAQSSVDLGAVIQSQLSGGRTGRGRGRGRGRRGRPAPGSRTAARDDADSVGHATPESENSLTPWSSPADSGSEPLKPARGGMRRGRRSRRGQGQRRGHAPSVASPLAIGPATPEFLRTDAALTPDTDALCRPAGKMYPIFCTKSPLTESTSPKTPSCPFTQEHSQSIGKECLRGAVKCETLLLPSSPAPQRPHVFTLGGNHLSLRFLLSHFDARDFHLPDEEFGSLKRHKLLSAARDLEPFVPYCSPYATRQRVLGMPTDGACGKRLRAAGGRLPTGAPRGVQAEGKPAGRVSNTSEQTDLGSDTEALVSNLKPCEVAHKQEGQACDWLSVESADGAEGGCVGAGQEEGSVHSAGDVAAGPSSPRVPNLSLTPSAPHAPKSTTLAVPSWGSPTFPSLGVTPAVPVHSRTPTQECTPSTPPKALNPQRQPSPESTAHRTPSQGPGVSCEPSAHAHAFSCTPCAGGHAQSHDAPCAALEEAESHRAEAFAARDQHAACTPPPDPAALSASDSSLCRSGSAFPPSQDHALPPAEDHRCNLPSPGPREAPSLPSKAPNSPPLRLPSEGEEKVSDRAEVSSGPEATPSTRLTDRPRLGSGRQSCADADAGSAATACIEEDCFTRGWDARKPAQASVSAPDYDGALHPGCRAPPAPDTLPSASLRSQCGEKDLDRYFTDSAWSRGVRTPSESGHGAWGHSPAETHPLSRVGTQPCSDTPPQSPLTARDGPLSCSLKLTHTLKAPAGRCLVDVCGVYGPGGWCVATAEEWEVCVWGQSSSQQWSLLHTWTFTEHPVISLLPVPDSCSLLCVSMGKLEIREARILCCAGAGGRLSQSALCTGEVQAVLGVSGARVACCAVRVSTQTVQVFTLSDDGRLEDTLSLVSPGQSVQALAAVDGQKDALIGSTNSSHLVLWNMRTGHLLQRFALGASLSGTLCVRGYSQSGVLFVLLQHRFLHNVNLDEGAPFSLIATNPVTAKSVLVHQLTRPSPCVGRFTEGDVWESAVVGLFMSGALAVWDLRDSDCVARLAQGPKEGCHIARWGGPSTLLVGHLSGDVFVYQYTPLGLL